MKALKYAGAFFCLTFGYGFCGAAPILVLGALIGGAAFTGTEGGIGDMIGMIVAAVFMAAMGCGLQKLGNKLLASAKEQPVEQAPETEE